MTERGFWSLADVSDERLERDLRRLIADDCRTEARIVAHLAEMDVRRLSLIRGRSLFKYCQIDLGLSDNQAFYRITAARTAREFPVVFRLLEHHHLHLTTIALISKYLTQENHLDLLRDVCGKSKREVLKILAARFPRPDVPNQIRKLPPSIHAFAAGPTATLEPLSPASYRLQLNLSETLKQKLDLAADLMSHSNPTRDLSVILERALDGLIEKLQKRRFGQASRQKQQAACGADEIASRARHGDPSSRGDQRRSTKAEAKVEAMTDAEATAATSGARSRNQETGVTEGGAETLSGGYELSGALPSFDRPKSERVRARRHIPNAVRHQLVERDGLRCTYRGGDGQRCTATAFLQIHHEHAWAKGGADTPDNLRLLCAHHNQLLAEQEFAARERKAG